MADIEKSAALATVDEEQPTFDFSELSWGDSLDLIDAQAKITDLIGNKDNLNGEAMKGITSAFMAISRHLSLVVTHVPGHWWANGAPAEPDYTDPVTYRWIKARFMGRLMKAMGDAQSAEKNE